MPLKIDHHRPISETPLKWRFAGASMAHHWMLAWKLCDFLGVRINIARKPYVYVIFQGGGGPDPLSPPLGLPMACI